MLDEAVQPIREASSESDAVAGGRSAATAKPASAQTKTRKKKTVKRVYAYGADRRNQSKTTDLIPKRVRAYSLVAIALLVCLGLLNALAYFAQEWRAVLDDASIASLQLTGRGTLAAWFGSFLFIAASAVSFQIYALRKHRCDDYRGSYRLWGWLSALFLISSVHCAIDLGGIFRAVFEYYAMQLPVFGVVSAWLVVQVLLLNALLIRCVYEVRNSRGTMAWLSLVWVAYTASIVLQVPAAQEQVADLGGELALGNGWLVATTALLLATVTYARYIYLSAHGMIKLPVAKPKRVKKPAAKKRATARKITAKSATPKAKSKPATRKRAKPKVATTVEPKTVKPPAKVASKPAAPLASRLKKKVVEPAETIPDLDEDESVINMSKAQRRRQRKQDKRQRRAA